jgi:hypothetical protein
MSILRKNLEGISLSLFQNTARRSSKETEGNKVDVDNQREIRTGYS